MKYSEEKFENIAKFIRTGVPAKHAAVANDIDESTYYLWLKEHQAFQALIKRAESERLVFLVGEIRKDPAWQSKAWLLERLYHKEFGSPYVREMNERLNAIEDKLEKLNT